MHIYILLDFILLNTPAAHMLLFYPLSRIRHHVYILLLPILRQAFLYSDWVTSAITIL